MFITCLSLFAQHFYLLRMMGWREADDAAARARFTPDAAVQISHSVKNSHHILESRLHSQGFNSAPIRRRYANLRRILHRQAGDD